MTTICNDGSLKTSNGTVLGPELFDPISSDVGMCSGGSSDIDLDSAFEELEHRKVSESKFLDPPSSPERLKPSPHQLFSSSSTTTRKSPKVKRQERVPLQDLFTSPNINAPSKSPNKPSLAKKLDSTVETFSQPFPNVSWGVNRDLYHQKQVAPRQEIPSSPSYLPPAAPDLRPTVTSPAASYAPSRGATRAAAMAARQKIQSRAYATSTILNTSDELEEPDQGELDQDSNQAFEELDEERPKKRSRRTRAPKELADDMAAFQEAISSSNPDRLDFGPQEKISPILLSHEQRRVLDMVVNDKKSIFFTGAAGTGKSVLLQQIIAELRKKYEKSQPKAITEAANTGRKITRVAVTASTGLAACHIGGVTLHSFAGIGLGREDVDQLLKKIRKNKKSLMRWRQVKVLVLDEVSMVDGALFDKLDTIARKLRRNELPFGGIQLVITGDFYQLPPVPDSKSISSFVFEANCWQNAVPNMVELRKVFRQKDPKFSSMLNELRHGHVSKETEQLFMNQDKELVLTQQDGITATELFPRKADVERANEARIRELKGESHRYKCEDWRDENYGQYANFDNLMCVADLDLKLGAQVMMIKNIDETLVNGTIGTVVGFMSESSFSMLNRDKMSRMGVEKLKRVIGEFNDTVQRNVEKAENELGSIYGPKKDDMSSALKRKHATLEKLHNNSQNLGQCYPLVRYALPNGEFRIQLAQPEEWKIEDYDGKLLATRKQVPLILAWALSIHKAQGQTLRYVKVDLSRAFETGQSYVALSRAVSLEGLQVLGFSKSRVTVNEKVVEFYRKLNGVPSSDTHDSEEEKPFGTMAGSGASSKRADTYDRSLFDFFKRPKTVDPSRRNEDEIASVLEDTANDRTNDVIYLE